LGFLETDIKEGKIVPVEITVKLLLNAMEKSAVKMFLVDGFPRSVDNYEEQSSFVFLPLFEVYDRC
jgi:adenylate kinase family enzyme